MNVSSFRRPQVVFAGILGALALAKAIGAAPTPPPTIGFVVKMPEQAWFISEMDGASAVGHALGFRVVRIGAPSGESLMAALDILAAQGASGAVICAPDVRLGPAVAARASALGLKLVTVDDRLVDKHGQPITTIPHLGMAAETIGHQVGAAIAEEMTRRGWDKSSVGVLALESRELPTAVARVKGATDALARAGVAPTRVFPAALKTTDTAGAAAAAAPVLAAHPEVHQWAIVSLNEETVLGGVRASEQFGLSPASVIGVGIGGAGAAQAEFSKRSFTGFFGTIAVSSRMHGERTTANLIRWIRTGERPPADTATTGTLMTRANWRQIAAKISA